jgi:thermostable 8-oxoguanine DNA glycosylase
MKPMTEEELDQHKDLSAVASERVTWEEACHIVQKLASQFFIADENEIADVLRDLGKRFDTNAKTASRRQTELLRKQHPELKI